MFMIISLRNCHIANWRIIIYNQVKYLAFCNLLLDGIGRVHDYVRWPIKWENFERNLDIYKNMGIQELNTWTTVSSLNIGDLKNIFAYTKEQGINHSWALLEQPEVLNVKYNNHFTRTADVPDELKSIVGKGQDNTVELQLWTYAQDQLRGIKLWDYYK